MKSNLKIFNSNKRMNCEYCNTVFKTISSLNSHKNKAKYCLLIQGKIEPEPEPEQVKQIFKCSKCEKILSSKQYLEIHFAKCKEEHECIYCNKILSTNQLLSNHLLVCLVKKDKELSEKDKIIVRISTQLENCKEQLEKQEENYNERIKDLQDKLDKIANKAIDRPTNSFTNTTNNNLNIMTAIDFDNLEIIKDLIDNNLNVNHVVEGQKGLVQFLIDTFLTDEEGNLKYKCTDASRRIYKFLNIDGETNKDIDAKKLISYIVSGGIKGKSVEIADRWYRDEDGEIDLMKYEIMNEPQKNILKIEEDSSSFRRELASMTSS